MQKTVLVTGATSGIGKACAITFARQHHRLIIAGRRNERLLELAGELKSNFKIEVLTIHLDVRNHDAVKSAIENLPENWKQVDILINNAGLAAGLDYLHEGSLDDWEAMIDTNVKGLLYVTRHVVPLLQKSQCPHIVNIGSIAGKEVYAKGNVYCASKFAVDALTKGMRIDFLHLGIKVSQIAPGAVDTEFSEVRLKGNKEAVAAVYKGYKPLCSEDVANAVLWVTDLPTHVNVNDLVIMPAAQANPGYLLRKEQE